MWSDLKDSADPTAQDSAVEVERRSVPLRLNLGCGRNPMPGWVNVDKTFLPGVDIVADLDQCRSHRLPFAGDSVGEFLLCHVIEHVRDTLALMEELHRIAKPDATLTVRVPFGASDDAWEDPTHVRAYFLQSFGYFSQPFYWRADSAYRGDWQPRRIHLLVHKEGNEHLETDAMFRRVSHERNVVREMICVMSAVKPIRDARKELQVPPMITFGFE